MKFINAIKNFIAPQRPTTNLHDKELLKWLGISNTPKKLISEVTYFTCIKMLSETLGKMPIKYYQSTPNGIVKAEYDKGYELLSLRPNSYMTPSIFWATIENNRNHYGNAYVWIRREFKREKYGGNYEIKDLWIMPSEDVQVIYDNKGIFGNNGAIYYVYSDRNTGEIYVYPGSDVMHFKTSMTFDGIIGKPVREILKSTLEGGLESQNFMNNLYKTGLTARMALQYSGDLDGVLEQKLIEKFEKYANGANNAGKIVPVPIGMQLTPLNIKLTDSQFFELKKFTALQIAGSFGIKPNQINNYEKSSYSNSEMQQLSFYVDTELFIIKHYEEEINFKILSEYKRSQGYYYKFNEKVILRTDSKTQAEIMSKYVNNGIYTPNEAREYLDMHKIDGADKLIVNGNYIPIDVVGKQYEKSGEG
ncbi:phage portal protein [uncultured Clostridium sp.]|uniref:phage portal protein n=1 Tax=uncultured Clostridium sp. TaxID=59620 RepID=UPI002617F5FD|nr:phage portal protein [uncultured Clostridium sp.]